MMSLCKTVHSILGLPADRRRRIPTSDAGGLRLLTGDPPRPTHVVESSAVGPAGRSSEPAEGDPGAWGLYEAEDHGGLGLCTESLGFESCDDRAASATLLPAAVAVGGDEHDICRRRGALPQRRRRGDGGKPEFPPPLPWLAGRRRCFMRGVRRDGRLQITEVTIERPEVLRASREDGRLRLQLVRPNPEESPAAAGEEEEVEEVRWEVPRHVARCQETVNSSGIPQWWGHRCVTTV